MEFSTRFPYSEMKLSAYNFRDFCGIEMGFPTYEIEKKLVLIIIDGVLRVEDINGKLTCN